MPQYGATPARPATRQTREAFDHAAEVYTVASSAVDKLSYDALTERLFVTYTSGRTYCYVDVPEHYWTAFLDSGSKGTFVNESIKPIFNCEGPL